MAIVTAPRKNSGHIHVKIDNASFMETLDKRQGEMLWEEGGKAPFADSSGDFNSIQKLENWTGSSSKEREGENKNVQCADNYQTCIKV